MPDIPGNKLSVLVIEDSQADTELNIRLLKKAGYDVSFTRVETEVQMNEALAKGQWDLILSDYMMPSFDVSRALEVYHAHDSQIPFIVISGAIGEEKAVQLIKSGVHDYLLKDNMARFIHVIERELREAANRKELISISHALAISEAKYRSYIDHAPDGVFVTDENGKYLEVNEAASRITGYTREELLSMSISDLLTEESMKEGLAQFGMLSENGTSRADLQFRHKDGSMLWWSVEAVKLAGARFLGFTKDITVRKNAIFEAIKAKEELEHLNRRLTDAREDERAAVAMEIHDELGQSLTAIKIDLNWVMEHLSDTPKSMQKIAGVIKLTNDTIKKVQRISSELRPELLDDLGLATAIEWYADEFEQRTGIRCELTLEDVPDWDKQINLALFRVFQEALTNVIRHSNATVVTINLGYKPEGITLVIQDDGVGIPGEKISSGKSLGLIGMRERAKQIGGTVEFEKIRLSGTKIVTFIPLPKQVAKKP